MVSNRRSLARSSIGRPESTHPSQPLRSADHLPAIAPACSVYGVAGAALNDRLLNA